MMKRKLYFIILSAVALGLLRSCTITWPCYDYLEWMTPESYSDTDYNSVSAIAYKYLSHPLGEVENGYPFAPYMPIYSEDSTVLDQEIKVYGELRFGPTYCEPSGFIQTIEDPKAYAQDQHTKLSNTISINYDTLDHAIGEKLKGLNKQTIYIKGHLRLYIGGAEENERFSNCAYMVPGIFIYSADDITLTANPDEDN